MEKKIRERKKDQEKKKWMSLRGDSDIYLLDIEDFSTIIQNNWSIFNSYFEDQNWIVKNIDEIASCRNPIAHHSYIGKIERDTIRINFEKIVKQISSVIEKI